MQKQRPAYNHLPRLEKSTLVAQKTIYHQPKKTKIKPIRNIEIEIKLNLTISLLLIVNLKSRLLRKINIMEIIKEVIQLLRLMPLK